MFKGLECEFETEQNISPFKQCNVIGSSPDKNKKIAKMNGEIKINDFSLLNDEDKLKIMINADKDKNSTKTEYCLQVFFKSQYNAIFDLLNISISKFNKNNTLLDYTGNPLKNSYIGISNFERFYRLQ